jgi:membrane protein implicated in regulation of membrane protease activity
MLWWHWLVLGLILVALEMAASGGFYVIFFGVAAIAIAGLRLLDVAGPMWLQLLLFSVLSVASLLFFRSPLLRWLKLSEGPADVDSLVGETAVAIDDIAAGDIGRVELRGTVWNARNADAAALARGRRCIVTRADQLTLVVKAEEAFQ